MATVRPTVLERIGGREALAGVVDAFYDRIEADPELRSIFPEDMESGREKQKAFLEQWMGGEPLYAQRYGPPAMRRRHLPFTVTERGAERWLQHFAAALDERGVDEDVAREIMAALRPLALRMVNTSDVQAAGGSGGSP